MLARRHRLVKELPAGYHADVDAEGRTAGEAESAWEAAEAYGFDMSLIEINLGKTPAERIRAHGRALAMALALKEAMERQRAGS